MRQKILILGTTPYTEVFVDMFETIGDIAFTGCVENRNRGRCGQSLAGLPIHWVHDIDGMRGTHRLICSLATTARSDWIAEMATRGFTFTTLVHPTSHVSRHTELGAGVSVDAGCVLAGFSRIGAYVRIGRHVSLGHHTDIDRFSTIHPGAIISGYCQIGPRVTVGTGAVIIDGIAIGEGAVIASGAVVTKDVPKRALVAGNPGLVKRKDYGPK